MIIDTSALLTVVFKEADYDASLRKLGAAPSRGIGTPSLVEAGLMLGARKVADPLGVLSRLLVDFEIVEVPFGGLHWREAMRAYRRFGRGRHPARLNFGDCMSYAVSRLAGEPLLYVGNDFSKTDIEPA